MNIKDNRFLVRTTNNDDFVVFYSKEHSENLENLTLYRRDKEVFTFKDTISHKVILEFLNSKYIPTESIVPWDDRYHYDKYHDDRPIIDDEDIWDFKNYIKNMDKMESDSLPLWLVEILILDELSN